MAEWICSCLLLIVQYKSTDMALNITHYVYYHYWNYLFLNRAVFVDYNIDQYKLIFYVAFSLNNIHQQQIY